MAGRVLFVGNTGDDDPGLVGQILVGDGWEPATLIREEHAAWRVPRFDLLVLLGSDWSVHWQHLGREVDVESALFLEAHGRGTPVLGLCYGAQLIAHALGGSVEPMPRAEIGWYEVASEHPALGGSWFEWHADAFVVPPGLPVLARTEAAPQAFGAGRTLAVQFHPEVTDEMIRLWIEAAGRSLAEDTVVDVDEILRRAVADRDARAARARSLVRAFLEGTLPGEARALGAGYPGS